MKKKYIKKLAVPALGVLVSVVILVISTVAWFSGRRTISTVTWIKTPIVLTIGSGNNRDIKFLDMGDIDVEASNSKDYVFCVYGVPVDNYSLQLAYTTNISLTYKVYRASECTDSDEGAVPSSYMDSDGVTQTEYFKVNSAPVITGLSLDALGEEAKHHQSHHMSYGDENGLNPIDTSKVQSYAEPLYWLAEENGTNVLRPSENILMTDDGQTAFLDYYILHIEWGELKNNKETDIVYLTVSR